MTSAEKVVRIYCKAVGYTVHVQRFHNTTEINIEAPKGHHIGGEDVHEIVNEFDGTRLTAAHWADVWERIQCYPPVKCSDATPCCTWDEETQSCEWWTE